MLGPEPALIMESAVLASSPKTHPKTHTCVLAGASLGLPATERAMITSYCCSKSRKKKKASALINEGRENHLFSSPSYSSDTEGLNFKETLERGYLKAISFPPPSGQPEPRSSPL